ncbi:MAG: rRNA maturation RNase YbeY [Chloroflexi bacterium]|nr:rRNA maturation RNase YbeY [Chloroflexota bacterium]
MDRQVEIRVKAKYSARVVWARLARVARKTLRAENANVALTIYVTDDAEIRKLNRAFHATDAPTDVLAFPSDGEGGLMWGRLIKRPYIGDIIISYERAREQARAAGWRSADELDLLAVHGILHLLGYDDRMPRKRARMWRRQEEILGRVIR